VTVLRSLRTCPRPTISTRRWLDAPLRDSGVVTENRLHIGATPILFVDNDKPAAAAKRANPVAAAQPSDQALQKAARKRTADDHPVHSFTSLIADLGTICANHIQPTDDMPAFTKITAPTPVQRQAFELLGVSHRFGLA